MTTRTLPRTGYPAKLNNWGRRALVRKLTKNLMITLAELQRSCVEMEETSRRTAAGTRGLVRVEEKLNRAKYRDILNENMVQSFQDLSNSNSTGQ